jgi:spore germination protein KA
MEDRLSHGLSQNLSAVTAAAGHSDDLLAKRVTVGNIPCCLLCCEGMISSASLAELVIEPLHQLTGQCTDGTALLQHLDRDRILSPDCAAVHTVSALLHLVHAGFAALLADGADFALCLGVQGYAVRSISEPSGEQNLYGAKEGFTESVRTNMSQIRRRMKTPALVFSVVQAGTLSQTDLCLCFLRDRVPQELADTVRSRLASLPLESVLSSGYVRPFLEESDTALVHSVGTTERPDILCAKLLEGRVGILIDGTPFALVIPQLFCESFQTLDDYNHPPAYATLLRWLKYAAALIALLLPAGYLAVSLWHPELLHETLLRLLTDSEQNAPFSIAAELLGILFMYETVREAGLRLPKAVGSAVGIIGGLLIGDAAVQSGLISTPVLTVAALSVTAGFVIPEHHAALTILRPAFILAAAVSGIPGIAILGATVLCRICATEIFGFPVSAPVSPLLSGRLGDILGRIGFRRLSQRNFRVEETRIKVSPMD